MSDNKIPTASQVLKKWGVVNQIDGSDISGGIEAMIEFAKLHVQLALKEQQEYYEINYNICPISELEEFNYPLENIK